MKNSTLITVMLIVLMALGWTSALLAPRNKEQEEINSHIIQAEDYIDRQLYQKAIEEYDAALAVRNDEHIWGLKLDAYKSLYEWNDIDFYKGYLQAATTGAKLFPLNVDFQIRLADLYIKKEDYTSAFKSLSDAVAAGNKDEHVAKYLFDVTYAFKVQKALYNDYRSYCNEFYTVSRKKDNIYYLKASDYTYDYNKLYSFAGPIGEDGIRLIKNELGTYIIDAKNVIQGIIKFEPEDCGVYADGLIPIKQDGKYSYYDILGDIQFDGATFDYAGTFTNGTAAVCVDKKWKIINKDGNPIDDKVFDDIVLFSDGTYTRKDVKLFKYDGKYHLTVKGEDRGSFDGADILTDDGLIAVCVNGKWGYVDFEGEMKIEPQFMLARSFSNGLAAVFNGESWGFINKDGQLAIAYQFLDVDYFDKNRNCMVALYVEEEKTVDINEEITDGEVLKETRHEYAQAKDDGTTEITGTKRVVVKYKRYQLITLYNEI